jgi:hypothetical protein
LEEIKEINQRLIDTVVEISDDEDAADPSEVAISSIGCEGTTVRFSFIAVSLSPALKAHLSSTQMSPIQPLRLLVPCSYPNGSPSLLDKLPVETRYKQILQSQVNRTIDFPYRVEQTSTIQLKSSQESSTRNPLLETALSSYRNTVWFLEQQRKRGPVVQSYGKVQHIAKKFVTADVAQRHSQDMGRLCSGSDL